MMGIMIIDNTVMTLGEGLGADDFPTECKFAITCKHGKPRDRDDMQNMFNMGRGKIYASPKGEEDILNLAGLEVATYGVTPNVGTQSLSKTGQGAEDTGFEQGQGPSNMNSSHVNAHSPADINTQEAFAQRDMAQQSASSVNYIKNMIGMIIDS
jgi:hypothetical protein